MKNKVLKTIGYIVGITWLFTACALDDEVYGMTMLFINVLCMAYLALFSWANNWWYDLEDYEDITAFWVLFKFHYIDLLI